MQLSTRRSIPTSATDRRGKRHHPGDHRPRANRGTRHASRRRGTQKLDRHARDGIGRVHQQDQQPSISLPGSLVSTSAGTPITFRTTAGRQRQRRTSACRSKSRLKRSIEAAGERRQRRQPGMINTVDDAALADQVEVRNIAPTLGGISRSVNVVSQTDHDRLIDILRQQFRIAPTPKCCRVLKTTSSSSRKRSTSPRNAATG